MLIESSMAHYFNQVSSFKSCITSLLHLFFFYLILHFKNFTIIFIFEGVRVTTSLSWSHSVPLWYSGYLCTSLRVSVILFVVLSLSCHLFSLSKRRVRHLPRCWTLTGPGIFDQALPLEPSKNLQGSTGSRSCSLSQSSPQGAGVEGGSLHSTSANCCHKRVTYDSM